MNKKLILGLVFLFLLMNSVFSAIPTADILNAYKFDNDLLDSEGSLDVSLIQGSSSYETGIDNNGLNLWSNGYVGASTNPLSGNTYGSISYWIKFDVAESTDDHGGIIIKGTTNANEFGGYINNDQMVMVARTNDNAHYGTVTTWSPDADTWYNIVYTWDGTEPDADKMLLYINNVEYDIPWATAPDHSTITTGSDFQIGAHTGQARYLNGVIDEVTIWDSTLTPTDVSDLYNSGTGVFYPSYTGSSPAINSNETIEHIIELEQNTPVEVNTNVFTSIYSANFTSPHNASAYISTTIESSSNLDRTQQCRVLVEGVDHNTTTSRTMTTGQSGNSNLISTQFPVWINETYQIDVQCRRVELSGKLTIPQSHTNVYVLSNISHTQVNTQYNNIPTTYTVLYNDTITTTSQTLSDMVSSIILDTKVSYTYQGTGTVELYAIVDGQQSEPIQRYGTIGSTGNGKLIFLAENVTTNTTHNVVIYGKSTSNVNDVSIVGTVKELLLHQDKIDTINITSDTISSSTWATVDTATINVTASNEDVVVLGSIATTGSTASTVYYKYLLNGNTSQEWSRSVAVAQNGITTVENLFTDVPIGQYTLTLQGKVDSGTATINGGSVITYIGEETDITQIMYNITAHSIQDNTSITNFSVTIDDAITYHTTNGYIPIVTAVASEDIFIYNVYEHFNLTLSDHDTSTNVQGNVTQFPYFYAYDLYTNQSVWGSITVNDNGTNATYQLPLYIGLNGTYDVWITNTSYFDKSILTTAIVPATVYNYSIVPLLNKHVLTQDIHGNNVTSSCTFNSVSSTGHSFWYSTYGVSDLTFTCSNTLELAYSTNTLVNDSTLETVIRYGHQLILTFDQQVNATVTSRPVDNNNPFVQYNVNVDNFTLLKSEFEDGIVSVQFGADNASGQRYDYDNKKLVTFVQDELKVVESLDVDYYLQIESTSGQGLKDATIWVYEYPYTSALSLENASLVGRYLSDNKVPTLIWLDSSKRYTFKIEKASYKTQFLYGVDPNDIPIETTKANPDIIQLVKSDIAGISLNTYSIYPKPLVDLQPNGNITLFITLPQSYTLPWEPILRLNNVFVVTEYRNKNGAVNGLQTSQPSLSMPVDYYKEASNNAICYDMSLAPEGLVCITPVESREFYITLYEGIDYAYTDDWLNVTIFTLDSTSAKEDWILIPMYDPVKSDIEITIDSDWDRKTLAVFGFIGLLMLVFAVKYFTQNQDYAFHTYLIGLVIVSLLTEFLYMVTIVVALYYGLLWVKSIGGGAGA